MNMWAAASGTPSFDKRRRCHDGGDDVGSGNGKGKAQDQEDDGCENEGKIEVAAGDVDNDTGKFQPYAGQVDDAHDDTCAGARGSNAQDLFGACGERLDQFPWIEGGFPVEEAGGNGNQDAVEDRGNAGEAEGHEYDDRHQRGRNGTSTAG